MRSRKQKWITAALIVALVLSLSTGTVLAYLSITSGSVTNLFSSEKEENPNIEETFADNVKTNVSVNVGSPGYAVYVRAVVVVTWEDASGNVHAQKPVAGTDYFIDLNSTAWFLDDGYYYHRQMVSSGSTAVLINSCRPLKAAPADGYTLHVQILSQTVQALGGTDADNTPAVTDAWGVSVDPATKELTP